MSTIGSLEGSPKTTATASTSGGSEVSPATTAARKEKAKEKEPAPRPTASAPPPEPARLDAATGYDLAREVQETRRTQEAERRLASDQEQEAERPTEGERFDPAPTEEDEARRDDLFQQRAAARGVNLYQTSLDPREETGSELNARF